MLLFQKLQKPAQVNEIQVVGIYLEIPQGLQEGAALRIADTGRLNAGIFGIQIMQVTSCQTKQAFP